MFPLQPIDYAKVVAREKDLEGQVDDLTKRLFDCNRKKKLEMDEFQRLLDEGSNEKQMMVEQHSKTVHVRFKMSFVSLHFP